MAFSLATRCLASVAEGKISLKLWNVDDNGDHVIHPTLTDGLQSTGCPGTIHEKPTGEQSCEFSVPRFVAFARNGAEVIVGYMEQSIM